MPFKRCPRCGKEFLARDDSQELCSPSCSGPREDQFEAQAKEDSWWRFPLFFLCCCALAYYLYVNAFDVELFLVKKVPFLRETMANKLASSTPQSLDQLLTGICDRDVEVAKACLDALVKQEKNLPVDDPLVLDLADELRAIFESPEEPIELKRSAVAAMGCIDSPETQSTLYRALHDRELVKGAVIAMKKVGTKRAVDPLSDIVIDEHGKYQLGNIRYQAVIALGLIEDESAEAVPALIKALRDPSGPIRDESLTALLRIARRWEELSYPGQNRVKHAVEAIRKFLKADRIFAIRQRSKEVADEIERIMK